MLALTLMAIPGLPHVQAGDDVAALILAAASQAQITFQPGDIVVIAQKIVSKAEGRQVNL